MTPNHDPLLSFILLAHCDSAMLRLSIARLRAQTIADRLELILVTERRENLDTLAPALAGFERVRILETAEMQGPGAAKAAGVRNASAPLVTFVEDHSYPAPDCAAALIQAHAEGEYAAVGPVVWNANPETTASWASYLVFYSAWMPPGTRGEVEHLPGNQSCYRREVLIAEGSRLDELLGSESVLHWKLRAEGRRLFLEPRARLYHLQFSRRRPVWHEYFLSSRAFAANRVSRWSASRRFVYAAGSLLLPIIRLPRIARRARAGRIGCIRFARAVPDMLATLTAGAAGEMLGYALGPGDAARRLIEFERLRHLDFAPRDLDAAARMW